MSCPRCHGDGVVPVEGGFADYCGTFLELPPGEEFCDCEAGAARERFDKYVFDPVEEKLEEEV